MIRKLLLTTALLSLFAADVAQAQQDRPRPPGPPGAGGPQVQPPRPGPGGPAIQPPRPGPGGPAIQPPRPGPGGPAIQPPRPGRPTPPRPPRPQPPRPERPRPPHRPGAGRPPQFRPIHGNPFRYPHGYGYRRWTVGLLLPRLFRSAAYYFSDYAALGVGPPPYGYRSVRYGPDLLLVNVRTGRIADVLYGAFY